ncbi:SixA phosphatase family protein [Amphibiibacter pelophylacis]|uniref:Histidine phosphatase family protein n=1 Tax=Amphibiibacter pelophylacis TaxID=1799477 RepID=A0ACC6P4D8_9BURK
MDLLLWRHAHAHAAQEGQSDLDRALSPKGHRQAQRMAAWLRRRLPDDTLVCSSPARRAIETVEALERDYQRQPVMDPQGRARVVLDFLQWPPTPRQQALAPTLLLVSHQPLLGDMLGLLLGLGQSQGSLIIRKGDVWWLRCEPDKRHRIIVRQVTSVDLL